MNMKINHFDQSQPVAFRGLRTATSTASTGEISLSLKESAQLVQYLQCCLWRSAFEEVLQESSDGGLSSIVPMAVFENMSMTLSKPGFAVQAVAMNLVEKSQNWRLNGVQYVALVGKSTGAGEASHG